jgi:hypothetical protein
MAAVPIKIVNAKIAGGDQLIEDATITGEIGLADPGVGGGPIIPDPIPPNPIDPPPDKTKPWEVKAVWIPEKGWVTILVPADDAVIPTPGRRR